MTALTLNRAERSRMAAMATLFFISLAFIAGLAWRVM